MERIRDRLIIIILSVIFLPVQTLYAVFQQNETIRQDTVKMLITSSGQPVYITSRLITPRPVIDGKLDDECWNHGTWAGNRTGFMDVPDSSVGKSFRRLWKIFPKNIFLIKINYWFAL